MVLRLGSKLGGFGTNAVMSVMTHARIVFRIRLVSSAGSGEDSVAHEPRRQCETRGNDRSQLFFDADSAWTTM
jgi:hypothetical protein